MIKQSRLTILVIVLFIVGAVGLVIWNESRLTTNDELIAATTEPMKNYTLANIAAHNNSDSCWTAIDGKVYDLTQFIAEHPGGSKSILVICGFDGTGSFNSMPEAILPVARLTLAKYKIGSLAQ